MSMSGAPNGTDRKTSLASRFILMTIPHIHALIVPVERAKSGRECVMWSAKFGKSRYEYGHILREMHTSLYRRGREQVRVGTW